jgi:hypothetical protein
MTAIEHSGAAAQARERAKAHWRQARGVRWALYGLEFALAAGALLGTQILSTQLWNLSNGDVDEYQQYAIAFWTQRPIWHALPVEYPPLAILPFTLTIVPPGINPHIIFGIWMGAAVLLGYYGLMRVAGRVRALAYLAYLLLGTAATLLARFDIVPALATLAALWALERRRFSAAYALLAVGVLLKLYPAFLIPVALVAHWRTLRAGEGDDHLLDAGWRRGGLRRAARDLWSLRQLPAVRAVARGALLCGGLVALGFAGALLLDPAGALTNLDYAGQRPLQVESIPASLLWLSTLFGMPAHPDYSFVSLNYVGQLDGVLRSLSLVALVGGCLWVYWRQARGRLTAAQAFLACVCVVLATNKILSPQYLIWVVPLVAYVEGGDLLWIAICFLTWLDFPIIYQWRHPIWTVTYSAPFMPVLALRNGLLLWVTVRAIIRPKSLQARAGPPVMTQDPAAAAGTAKRRQGDAEPMLAG